MDRYFWRHTFLESSRGVFLLTLVYAPWAYGCASPWTSLVLEGLLAIALLLWLGGCSTGNTMPDLSRTPLVCAALLILYGAFMGWNPHYRHDPAAHIFLPISAIWPLLPGSIDADCACAATRHAALMLGAMLLVADTARERIWRRRFLATMALTGASVALLGLLQRATAAPMIFWQPGHTGSPFFGTYYYHGNAGAFLNLVLPLVAAFAARSFQRPGRGAQQMLWLPATLICLAAAAVNVSRAAAGVTALLVTAMAVFQGVHYSRARAIVPRLSAMSGALLLGCALWAISLSAGSSQALEKWGWLKGQLNEENPRYIVAKVCVAMAKDSGPWGFGPGTFGIAFPHYTEGDAIRGVWHYAHQDYLQTLIEWGWIGTAAWLILIFGGIWRLFRGRGNPETNAFFRFACGLSLTGMALHALVDFPFQIASLQLYAATLAGVAWSHAEVIDPGKAAGRNAGGAGRP